MNAPFCPHCADAVKKYGSGYHRVVPKRDEPHKGLPLCESHGCVLVDGEWIFECHKCKERVDKLYALFVPHLCKSCFDAAVAHQRESGNICSLCHQPRMLCCC